MLYLDPFSDLDFRRLDAIRADHCVSIYIPTHTVSRETEQDKSCSRTPSGKLYAAFRGRRRQTTHFRN